VSEPTWVPPEPELRIGLEFYATGTSPLSATIKGTPEDFRVREISSYPVPDPTGPFTVLRIESRNWEQHELGERIAQRIGLAPHAIAWAGTKDRRAIADRLLSYRGAPPTAELGLAGVRVLEAYRARDGLVLGHHYGNAFEIRLVPVTGATPIVTSLSETLGELREIGGFPNFFGPQRFGEVRPVTHEVGGWIVRGDLDRAVETYLSAYPGLPGTQGYEARCAYSEHHDAVRALREFPSSFRFERQLLDHLARGHTSERALRALSRELRTLFVHAFQAWSFNRWLSARHRHGSSFVEPIVGDTLLRVARDGTVPGTGPVPVLADNLPECTDWVQRGRARVAGPLVGFETELPDGPPGAWMREILHAEGIEAKDFELPRTPEIASRGSWRPAQVPIPPVGIREEMVEAGTEEGASGVWLSFALPKGTYATVLVRELSKTGARITA
jgi:tRNA pseudouridine13 synthase